MLQRVRWGKRKWNVYLNSKNIFHMSQCYSGERCGPWASCYIFEEDLALYLNKLEFSLPKDNLYKVWMNLACSFWRKFLKNVSVFLLFRYYLPLGKGYPLSLNKLISPLPKDDLCQVWLKLAKGFWRRSRKCKSLQTDGRRTTGDQNSSLELSAQVS